MFIKSAPEAEAEGNLREIYESDERAWATCPNHARGLQPAPRGLASMACFQGSFAEPAIETL